MYALADNGALAELDGARAARSDPIAAERAIHRALAIAPFDLEVRLAAYKFYFYSHRLRDALPHAEYILAHTARRLNVGAEWRAVHRQDADFGAIEDAPSLYLQALLAWGYCNVRVGEIEAGRAAIAKVSELDARDRFGACRLLTVIEKGPDGEER